MKYKELKEPGTILKEGDEYIKREDLFNKDTPVWKVEQVRSFGGAIGRTIGEFPDHAFRRPEPEPIEVTLNPHYKAKVYSDKVVVNNCHNGTFGFEAIEYLASMVRRVKEGGQEIRHTMSSR